MTEIKETQVKGAEEARSTLPALLDRAERGTPTVISGHRALSCAGAIALYDAIQRAQSTRAAIASLAGRIGDWLVGRGQHAHDP